MSVLVFLAAVLTASLGLRVATATCPPTSGIYLMHGGYCLPEYTVISDIALTADKPLHCVLAGSTETGRGQWTGPGNTTVQCGGSASGPFTCSQSSGPTGITLYKNTGTLFSGKQLYTCTISGQSISVQIKNNTVLAAIYIEPPADVRRVPQNYTIHCITTGQSADNITVELFLEKHHRNFYFDSNPSPVSNYIQYPPLVSSTDLTHEYSDEVVWSADTVVVDQTEFSAQGLSSNNGDHDWACGVYHNVGFDNLQTYIRAPNFTPTQLTVLHMNATSVTISWTAVDASDADGYVVYSRREFSTVTNASDVGNVTQYTLGGLVPGYHYFITVRAYQDLLGPNSTLVFPLILPVYIESLTWTLLSERTSPEVQYCVYCPAIFVVPDHIMWRKNNASVMNSTSHMISYQLMDAATDNYTNILTVSGEEHQNQTITCQADYGHIPIPTSRLTIEAPSGPPLNLSTMISVISNISVSWSAPVGGANGYVILYTAEGGSNMTQLVEGGGQTSSVLTGLSKGQLYTIRVFAYKDLPSLLTDPVHVLYDAPGPVSGVSAKALSPPNAIVSWTPPNAPGTLISQYTISCFSTTCPLLEKSQTDNVTVSPSSTSTQLTLQSGQVYNISVKAHNALGESKTVSISFRAPSTEAPSAPPEMVNATTMSSSTIHVSWGEVPCPQRNGEITGYIVEYSRRGTKRQVGGKQIHVTDRTTTITGLDPLTEYIIKVAAVNRNGTGPFSVPVYETTNEALVTTQPPPGSIAAVAGGAGAGVAIILVVVVVVVVIVVFIVVRRYCRKEQQQHVTKATYDYVDTSFTPAPQNGKQDSSYQYAEVEEKEADVEAINYMYAEVKGKKADGEATNYLYAEVKDKKADLEVINYSYSEVGKKKQEQESTYMEATYMELAGSSNRQRKQPSFDHKIATISPIPLKEMSDYMATCHSYNNKDLFSQFEELSEEKDRPASVGFSEQNMPRNRFKNITTYDDNRVILQPIEDHEHDFVNASYVDGYSSARKFIACQGPLKKTVVDFWRMIWQERSQCIVMVTNLVEVGKSKCEQYWPSSGSQTFGPFTVSVPSETVLPDFTIRTLRVCVGEETQTITQYHFTSWPDHGVPEYGSPLMALRKKVMANWRKDGGPILVHCSAGVGRTGTFITIDIALEQAKTTGVVDIAGVVNRLREQRMQMVQTEQQYIFLHDAVLEYVVCGQTEIPCDNFTKELTKLKRVNPTSGKSKLQNEFELLSKVTLGPEEGLLTTALSCPEKNRTQHYLPNERWRVPLKREYPGYIHASFVNGYRQKKTFIIAQSPMENTVRDFWKMVVDYKVPVVVMLCDLEEDRTLCQYWPVDGLQSYGEFVVELLSQAKGDGFIRRNIKILKEGEQEVHNVVQFHVTMWPASGVAHQPGQVIALMDTVLAVCRKRVRGPVVIHCSDTVSRSGLYCSISNAVEQCKAEGVVDVFQAVKWVRMQKPGAVTTQEQYNFIFDVVVAFLGSYENYANFSQI